MLPIMGCRRWMDLLRPFEIEIRENYVSLYEVMQKLDVLKDEEARYSLKLF